MLGYVCRIQHAGILTMSTSAPPPALVRARKPGCITAPLRPVSQPLLAPGTSVELTPSESTQKSQAYRGVTDVK